MLFSGYLIATDMDGTFTRPGDIVSPENAEAIRYFQANGGLFTVASGRNVDYITGFRELFIPNAPIIALNGAAVYDASGTEMLHSVILEHSILDEIDFLARTGLCDFIRLWTNREEPFIWRAAEHGHIPIKEYFAPAEEYIWYKVIFSQSRENTVALHDLMRRNIDWYESYMSWPEGVEILAKGATKGTMLDWIKTYYKGKVHTAIGVGDYENDIPLVRHADIGYAVENAIPEVKAAADRITVRNTDSAIAHIIADIKNETENRK